MDQPKFINMVILSTHCNKDFTAMPTTRQDPARLHGPDPDSPVLGLLQFKPEFFTAISTVKIWDARFSKPGFYRNPMYLFEMLAKLLPQTAITSHAVCSLVSKTWPHDKHSRCRLTIPGPGIPVRNTRLRLSHRGQVNVAPPRALPALSFDCLRRE
jgi:hypothetical protein